MSSVGSPLCFILPASRGQRAALCCSDLDVCEWGASVGEQGARLSFINSYVLITPPALIAKVLTPGGYDTQLILRNELMHNCTYSAAGGGGAVPVIAVLWPHCLPLGPCLLFLLALPLFIYLPLLFVSCPCCHCTRSHS